MLFNMKAAANTAHHAFYWKWDKQGHIARSTFNPTTIKKRVIQNKPIPICRHKVQFQSYYSSFWWKCCQQFWLHSSVNSNWRNSADHKWSVAFEWNTCSGGREVPVWHCCNTTSLIRSTFLKHLCWNSCSQTLLLCKESVEQHTLRQKWGDSSVKVQTLELILFLPLSVIVWVRPLVTVYIWEKKYFSEATLGFLSEALDFISHLHLRF